MEPPRETKMRDHAGEERVLVTYTIDSSVVKKEVMGSRKESSLLFLALRLLVPAGCPIFGAVTSRLRWDTNISCFL